MNILVTGGAGFMGSNFIRYLLAKYPEYAIVNFDKLTYAGNLDNVKDVEQNPRHTFVQGDICSASGFESAIKKYAIDVIVNYAAETHVDRSIMDPEAFLRTDVIGTYHLLEATRKFGLKKMVQVSTDEVFGSIADGFFTENSPFQPNSPYAASKAGGDLLCRAYHVTYRTPVVVTHSCNFFGPYQYPEKFIPLFITNLLEGKTVPLYGDGKNVREWIYVDDHCRAIDVILHHAAPGSVYNIGTSQEIQNIEVVRAMLNILHLGDDMIEYVTDRPGHDRRYAIDWTRLKKDFGWEPKVSFVEGLQKTIAWYQENRDWWEKIKNGEYRKYYEKQYVQR